MIHEATEDRVAVSAVRDRVEDVLVPHLIDEFARHDARLRMSPAHC